jgi:hypothetical protein
MKRHQRLEKKNRPKKLLKKQPDKSKKKKMHFLQKKNRS